MPTAVHRARDLAFRLHQWDVLLTADEFHCSVCLQDDELVGFILVKPNSDQDLPQAAFELHAMYIDPAHRGGAVGARLALAGVNSIPCVPSDRFSVWVFRDNPMKFAYRALGMNVRVQRDRTIAGEKVPELGLLSPQVEQLVQRFALMSVRPRPVAELDASGSQQRSRDRWSRIAERIPRYPAQPARAAQG